jgi:hypothetical protein
MPSLKHENPNSDFGGSVSLVKYATFIRIQAQGFSLKAVQEKTESFENVSLKQPLLAAHPLWENLPAAKTAGLQTDWAMQWGAVFEDLSSGSVAAKNSHNPE